MPNINTAASVDTLCGLELSVYGKEDGAREHFCVHMVSSVLKDAYPQCIDARCLKITDLVAE